MKQTPLSNSLIESMGMVFDLGMYSQNTKLRAMFHSHQYEKNEIWMVENFLVRELPVVELGGSIGVVSCVINKLLSYPQKHIVVEANPYLIPLLRSNKNRNKCQFKIVTGAIGYGSQVLTLHVSTRSPSLGNCFVEYDKQVQVKTVSLRKLLDENDLQNICLVSDIEGAEDGLLNSEMEVITKHVKLLIFESHAEYLGSERVQYQLNSLVARGFETVFSEDSFHVLKNNCLS